jgi:hypothetical protein
MPSGLRAAAAAAVAEAEAAHVHDMRSASSTRLHRPWSRGEGDCHRRGDPQYAQRL